MTDQNTGIDTAYRSILVIKKTVTPTGIPAWLAEAIEEGEPLQGLANKRGEDRMISALYCQVQQHGPPAETLSAKVFNVSASGLGMVTRKPIAPGQRLTLSPNDGSHGACVELLVAHCTQTVQGYKVGCTFVVK